MDYDYGVETIKRKIELPYVYMVASLQAKVTERGLGLRPSCTPALFRTVPLQLQYAACGIICTISLQFSACK